MEASGYKVTRSGNATILDNGVNSYTVYDVARSTGGPTAVRSVGGEQTLKTRLKPMTEPIVERHEKWEPVEGIATPAARAVVAEDKNGLVVTMIYSETVDDSDSDLRIRFGRVPGYTVYEEFVHPWDSPQTESPMIGDGRFVYPLLVIHDSEWLRSLSDRLINNPGCVHYRLLTLDQIVDVLSNKQPEASWVKRPKL
jgi:hypothetical protein